jgi:hypothetical protein
VAVSEFDLFKINRYCTGKVPEQYLDQMRIESSVRGNSVTIVECRAPWTESLTEWSRHNVAQIRFDADTGNWSLYWRDRNSKWHPFDLVEPGTVDQMLAAIDEDTIAIFWG